MVDSNLNVEAPGVWKSELGKGNSACLPEISKIWGKRSGKAKMLKGVLQTYLHENSGLGNQKTT